MPSSKELPFTHESLANLASSIPTPFQLYNREGIATSCRDMGSAFMWNSGYTNFFAVKATPNPDILKICSESGFGFDCSSLAELLLVESVGASGEKIMFSSNETALKEYKKAYQLGAIINFDDISHIDFFEEKVGGMPVVASLRYNPGPRRTGNVIIGDPKEAKFGVTRDQLFEGYKLLQKKGVKRFGLHTMVVSNSLKLEELVETATMLFELAGELKEKLNIRIEFVNLGGGVGVAYKPEDTPVSMAALGEGIQKEYERLIKPAGLHPLRITHECGRGLAGPHGYLVTRVVHQKNTYKNYLGMDANMANLMRPSLYGAYHHMTVIRDQDRPHPDLPSKRNIFSEPPPADAPKKDMDVYDVVGSLCENNDKLAVDRRFDVKVNIGDLIVIHDTGAHGHSMGFNYNGKLRCAEYLWSSKGLQKIRSAETYDNLFATLTHKPSSTICVYKRVVQHPLVFAAVLGCVAVAMRSMKQYSFSEGVFSGALGAALVFLGHAVKDKVVDKVKEVLIEKGKARLEYRRTSKVVLQKVESKKEQ